MTDKELFEKLNAADNYNLDDLNELMKRTGFIKEWRECDGETFEDVYNRAFEKLQSSIYIVKSK